MIKVHTWWGLYYDLKANLNCLYMSLDAYTWDIHVFEIVWNWLMLFLLRYTYPSKDRQSFLKTLLVYILMDGNNKNVPKNCMKPYFFKHSYDIYGYMDIKLTLSLTVSEF